MATKTTPSSQNRASGRVTLSGVRFPPRVDPPPAFLNALARACSEVQTDDVEVGDWWPLALAWQHDEVPVATASAIARPATANEVADVLRVCSAYRVPVTTAGGRSGLVGGALPVLGGIVLDTTRLAGISAVDPVSHTVDVFAGTNGAAFEAELRDRHGMTGGHWPGSMEISTVGGWLACRSAGQLSTRYGKIEDMVVSLEVALADGSLIRTGGTASAAVGPDLNQFFIGSEGTLGVITAARLRVHAKPESTWKAAYGFASFDAGLRACRQIVQRGATPALLRLYDATEAGRAFGTGNHHVLLAYDEGDPVVLGSTQTVVESETSNAVVLDAAIVEQWLDQRTDVSPLVDSIERGRITDAIEVSGAWADLGVIYARGLAALRDIEGMEIAAVHVSHARHPPEAERESFYVRAWDAAQHAALASGASLSHHHGVGINRARFVHEALGTRPHAVLQSLKDALDPVGVLNPGKLGLTSPLGEVRWP
jgi:alkyldihydroxyacetonephosphate synthase